MTGSTRSSPPATACARFARRRPASSPLRSSTPSTTCAGGSARSIDARTERWTKALPKAPEDLWDALVEFDVDSREALFAHCAALTVNAVDEAYNHRPPALAHADLLATRLGLDMAAAGWTPSAGAYLGRVTKARIREAVREANGADAADRIAGLRKPEMVAAAEELLGGTGWLTATDPIDEARLGLLLGELRLPGIKHIWPSFAERADNEGWPAARFLAALAEHELTERARRRIERHLAEARLPPGKTLDSFDFDPSRSISFRAS